MSVHWMVARRGSPVAGVLAVMALAALLIAACGGGSSDNNSAKSTAVPPTTAASGATPATTAKSAATAPPQASSGEIDACKLVTKAEVEAAVGVTVSDPKPDSVGNLYACRFADPAPPNFAILDLSVLAGVRDGDAKEVFDMAKKNGNDPQTVSGLGDDAFWDDVLHSLNVVKGNYLVSVDVSTGDNRLTVAKTVAGQALGRLP